MGYKYSFVGNEIYGADDINEITKRLVTSGVEDPFIDGVPHNLKCFNNLTKGVVTDGVLYESDTTLKVSSITPYQISIESGTAFFKSGATITIDENKVLLSITYGKVNYIYLEHNEVLNVIRPVSSFDEPEGDFVLLAVVDELGNIEDKRKYAVGKVPRYVSGYDLPKKFDVTVSDGETFKIDVQGTNYNYFVIIVKSSYPYANSIDTFAVWSPLESEKYTYAQIKNLYIQEASREIPIRVYDDNLNVGGYLSLKYAGNILTATVRRITGKPIDCTIEFTAI